MCCDACAGRYWCLHISDFDRLLESSWCDAESYFHPTSGATLWDYSAACTSEERKHKHLFICPYFYWTVSFGQTRYISLFTMTCKTSGTHRWTVFLFIAGKRTQTYFSENPSVWSSVGCWFIHYSYICLPWLFFLHGHRWWWDIGYQTETQYILSNLREKTPFRLK